MDITAITVPVLAVCAALTASATITWTAAKAFHSFDVKLFSSLAEIKDEIHRNYVSRTEFLDLRCELKDLSQTVQTEIITIRERSPRRGD